VGVRTLQSYGQFQLAVNNANLGQVQDQYPFTLAFIFLIIFLALICLLFINF
jgi:hypothetical protein